MINDPISDMIARIKNGYLAERRLVAVPHTRLAEAVARVLLQEGYLKEIKVEKTEGKPRKELLLTLQYHGKTAALIGTKCVSKPGLRVYKSRKNLGWVRSGLGISIVSTSAGLMTDRQAKKKKIGGEIICKVW